MPTLATTASASDTDPLSDGLEQIERYLQRLGLSDGFLVIFDRRGQAREWALRMRTEAAQITSCKGVLALRG